MEQLLYETKRKERTWDLEWGCPAPIGIRIEIAQLLAFGANKDQKNSEAGGAGEGGRGVEW